MAASSPAGSRRRGEFKWLLFRVPSPPPPGRGPAGSLVTAGLAGGGAHLWGCPEIRQERPGVDRAGRPAFFAVGSCVPHPSDLHPEPREKQGSSCCQRGVSIPISPSIFTDFRLPGSAAVWRPAPARRNFSAAFVKVQFELQQEDKCLHVPGRECVFASVGMRGGSFRTEFSGLKTERSALDMGPRNPCTYLPVKTRHQNHLPSGVTSAAKVWMGPFLREGLGRILARDKGPFNMETTLGSGKRLKVTYRVPLLPCSAAAAAGRNPATPDPPPAEMDWGSVGGFCHSESNGCDATPRSSVFSLVFFFFFYLQN